ncbi:MAG: VWA domain-containing protein [Terriglobales bacterium]|jgi:VWFA-related protein
MASGVSAQNAETPLDATYRSAATFRSDASEVRMSFSTTDRDDRVIATLQPSDFAIVDHDLVIRDFRSFTLTEYSHIDVTLLVDESGSISPQFRQELASVTRFLAQSGGVPEQSFSILSFRDLKPTVLCQGNCRALDLGAQFPPVSSGGQTPLYDSVVFAARLMGQRSDHHTRKFLVIFSDGADTISLRSFSDAVDSALDNDVAIYTVDVSKAPHVHPGTLILRALAVNTGGRSFSLESGASNVLDAILKDFHATYTVAYKLPSHAAGFHLVRILPTRDLGLQFHCRRGYYYPNPEN